MYVASYEWLGDEVHRGWHVSVSVVGYHRKLDYSSLAHLSIYYLSLSFMCVLYRGRYRSWRRVLRFIPDRVHIREGGVPLQGHLASTGEQSPVQCFSKGWRKCVGSNWILRQYDDGEFRVDGRRRVMDEEKKYKASTHLAI